MVRQIRWPMPELRQFLVRCSSQFRAVSAPSTRAMSLPYDFSHRYTRVASRTAWCSSNEHQHVRETARDSKQGGSIMTGLLSLGGKIAPVGSKVVQEIVRAGTSFWARAGTVEVMALYQV